MMKAETIKSLEKYSTFKAQMLFGAGLVAPIAGVLIGTGHLGVGVRAVVETGLLIGGPIIAALGGFVAVMAHKDSTQVSGRVTAEQPVAVSEIARLEREVAYLNTQLAQASSVTLNALLPTLQSKEIALLYVGREDTGELVERLSKVLGPREVNHTIRHLWILNHAKCSDEKREEFRALFDGMEKF